MFIVQITNISGSNVIWMEIIFNGKITFWQVIKIIGIGRDFELYLIQVENIKTETKKFF